MRFSLVLAQLLVAVSAHAPKVMSKREAEYLMEKRELCKNGLDCILADETTEGPYYIEHPLIRSEILEDRQGAIFDLTINVIDVTNCKPVDGVYVDIWHTDERGEYSGWATETSTSALAKRGIPVEQSRFCRGVQKADHEGKVNFKTVIPGWYQGRTTHIHIRVHYANATTADGVLMAGKVSHTGQFFFDDSFIEKVSTTLKPYIELRKKLKPKLNKEDGIFNGGHGSEQVIKIKENSDESFTGTITVGIDPNVEHTPGFGHGGPDRGRGPPGDHQGPPGDGMGPPRDGSGPPGDGCPPCSGRWGRTILSFFLGALVTAGAYYVNQRYPELLRRRGHIALSD